MSILLTFTNISWCTSIVAICRNLNKILLKLTTQLNGHTRTSDQFTHIPRALILNIVTQYLY